MSTPLIEIRTGSDSDTPKIRACYETLDGLGIDYSARILSAHRTPEMMTSEARELESQGYRVSIGAAGGSAHLAGMTASETLLPVVALPVKSSTFNGNMAGMDSLLSMIQMPPGIPNGCVGIGQAENAALIATRIAYLDNKEVRNALRERTGIDPLERGVSINNKVGLIAPTNAKYDSAKIDQVQSLLCDDMGMTVNSSIGERDSYRPHDFRGVLYDIENSGASSVIVICSYSKEGHSWRFPSGIAHYTDLPVIALPFVNDDGTYSEPELFERHLFSRGDMRGPIATQGISRHTNAGLYAAQIAGIYDSTVRDNVKRFRESLAEKVRERDRDLRTVGWRAFV